MLPASAAVGVSSYAMPVRIGTGLSTSPDQRAGALEAALTARDGLGGEACDLAVVFASGTHLAAPEAVLEAVNEGLSPAQLVGCAAGGVLASRREVEEGTAVAVWAAQLDGGSASGFHAVVEEIEEGAGALAGMPELDGADGAILLADPATFPTDAVLRFLSESAPTVPLVGGLASARTAGGGTALFLGEEVVDEGAVGVRLDGVELLPCVSQGASPIGPELTITAADGNIIVELAGKPALEKLRETIEGLPAEDLALVQGGLLMGIVVDVNKPDYVQGDFLVRGLMGADPDTGQVAVAADVRAGQVVRLHARDAASADRDLREALSMHMRALGGRRPAGALVFSCNGRGRGLFGHGDHDAEAVADELAGAPAAGFFAAGEIGPVGGETFLHGFTATVAVFA
jgi:small ligand-binding sensory domain FIST